MKLYYKNRHCLKPLNPRSALKSAFNEFSAMEFDEEKSPDERFYHLDINSSYAEIAPKCKLPTGKSEPIIVSQLIYFVVVRSWSHK